MTLPFVLITHSLPLEWTDLLRGKVDTIVGPVDALKFPPEFDSYLERVEGLLCLLTIPVKKDLLDRMPALRVISNMAVGVDNIDLHECSLRGIPVGNTPGVLTNATADLTMGLILSTARKLISASRDAANGLWKTWSPAGWLGLDLDGATLGIVGMGKIGKAVSARARSFGMKVVYYDNNTQSDMSDSRVSFDELLKISDIISLHCPLTDQTRGMFDSAAFGKMKKSSILINAARGPVVVTESLYQALVDGSIAAAGLDVTDPEPLPPSHPLFHLPNCVILPHIGSATHGTRRKMAEIACENLLSGLDGRRMPYCVNTEVYK